MRTGSRTFQGYLIAVLLVGVCAILLLGVRLLGVRHTFIFFYPAVLIAGMRGGFKAGLLAAGLSAFLIGSMWLPPDGSVWITDPVDVLTLLIFLSFSTFLLYILESVYRKIRLGKEAEAQVKLSSEREKAAAIIQESEERFRTLADNISQLAWMADEKGWLFWYNKRWHEYTGMTLEELEGWGWTKAHHPDHVDRVVRRIQRAWDTGKAWEDTFPLRGKDGEYRWFLSRALPISNEAGETICWFGTNTDITQQLIVETALRNSEQALREARDELENRVQERTRELQKSERTLHTILSTIPVAALVIDAESGTVRLANRSATDLLGKFPGEITTSVCAELFRPFLSEQAGRSFRNWDQSVEETIRLENGKEVHVLKRVSRVSLGGRTHIVGCLLDITDKKIAEQEASRKAELLVHADKMISLGVMAAGITHEINNPNTFISLNAPILKMTWEALVERLDEYADENGDFPVGELPYSRVRQHIPVLLNGIIDGSERIKNIVQDMKEFVTDKTASLLENVDINEVLRASLNLLSSKLKRSTDNLTIDYGIDLPAVTANPQRLGQVAINLILNGVEALEDKSKALNVQTYYEPWNKNVCLEVKDAGPGMDPQHLSRVFDPFFTTKRESGGTGLGLAISQKIAQTYGGSIVITSEMGAGTVAVLKIPARSEKI